MLLVFRLLILPKNDNTTPPFALVVSATIVSKQP